jgi:hypothetical protein
MGRSRRKGTRYYEGARPEDGRISPAYARALLHDTRAREGRTPGADLGLTEPAELEKQFLIAQEPSPVLTPGRDNTRSVLSSRCQQLASECVLSCRSVLDNGLARGEEQFERRTCLWWLASCWSPPRSNAWATVR